MDWDSIRTQFPSLSDWTYLNTATFGQLPRCAVEASAEHFARRVRTASADFLDWYDDADRLRGSVARLLHATAQDIAFAPSAAHALSTVVAAMSLKPEDLILTLEGEFPNQLYQGNVRETQWENFFEAIDSKVKLVAVSEVNYASGFRPPLAQIASYLKEREIPFYVDGTQSLGALQFSVEKIPVSVYAVHGYKWMISPPGAAFFYISPEFRGRIQPGVVGWRSHKDWRNVDNLHHGSPEFSDTAEKYEGGGLPNSLLYAMEASVNLLLVIGSENIEFRVLGLAKLIREKLQALGGQVQHAQSQIVAAKFPGQDVSLLARRLKEQRILVSARHGHLRVSPHFYNNEEDLERLDSALRALL
jgi:selenocysteine lyase/cysteine desulfurase